ncbi:MAG: hypothetical protein IH586_12025, partial [Anaerolineaceae bacterium]|nr:hypothetical protein [Anaerolineaceae bacterium]
GRAGGFIDLVEPDSNGCLFDPHSPELAAQALRQLLTNPDLLKAQRESSRRIAARFDLDFVVDQYEDCFLQIAGKNKSRDLE